MFKFLFLVALVTINGYQVVEGGLAPISLGMGGGGGGMGMGGMGMGGMGMGGMGMGGMGMGMGGMGMGGMGFGKGLGMMGGSSMDNSFFNGGKKNLNDLFFKKAQGADGMQFGQGQAGFMKGDKIIKDLKGENGYYNGMNGGKKLYQNGQGYQGGQHFGKQGKKGGMQNVKKGHKKGHTVKGFKTSKQKDESSKMEEFYDEEDDQAGKVAFNGESGAFGEKKDAEFKGKKAEGVYKAGQAKKEGHFANKHLADKEMANVGKFGNNKFAGEGAIHNMMEGGDANSMGGHKQSGKMYKHYPIYG